MRRSLLALAAFAVVSFFAVGDASACCHKKARCAEPVACAPAPCPEPVACTPKKKCGGIKLFAGCHKKKAVCETVAYETSVVAPSAQSVAPSGQGY